MHYLLADLFCILHMSTQILMLLSIIGDNQKCHIESYLHKFCVISLWRSSRITLNQALVVSNIIPYVSHSNDVCGHVMVSLGNWIFHLANAFLKHLILEENLKLWNLQHELFLSQKGLWWNLNRLSILMHWCALIFVVTNFSKWSGACMVSSHYLSQWCFIFTWTSEGQGIHFSEFSIKVCNINRVGFIFLSAISSHICASCIVLYNFNSSSMGFLYLKCNMICWKCQYMTLNTLKHLWH